MTRPLRVNIEDGWYHVTARGLNRQAIYADDGDRRHFLELLEEMVERFGIRLHAYVLMDNHYHLLIRTPRANASSGLQWLNVSYGLWFNRRHGRVGPVFQGRFKSILVDGQGSWALELSRYVHLNPIRLKALGQGKVERKQERAGVGPAPTQESIRERLSRLRGYRWSSYRAYAGYEGVPAWLDCAALWARAKRGRQTGSESYRRSTEDFVRQGVEEDLKARVVAGMAIGTTRFLEDVRRRIKGDRREQPGIRQWERTVPFATVVGIVERLKGEKREAFWERRGDWGRDVALLVARRRCGLTLKELGVQAGGLDYLAVSKAISRLQARASADRHLAVRVRQVDLEMSKV